jgi:hypothetical protein
MEDYVGHLKLARTTKWGPRYITLPQDGQPYLAGAFLSKKNLFPDALDSLLDSQASQTQLWILYLRSTHCRLVMCRLRLGLKAPALAWLEAARAWKNHRSGQKPKVGPGLAWLWPKPRLLGDISVYRDCHSKKILFTHLVISKVTT